MAKNSKKRKTVSLKKITKTNSHKSGLPPGTLVYTGNKEAEKINIELFSFSEKNFINKENITIEEAFTYINSDNITWINIDGFHDIELLKKIGKKFNISNLILEDIINTNQRAKFEEFENYMCIILKMLTYNEIDMQVEVEQVGIIFGNNIVITLQEGKDKDVFDNIRERLKSDSSSIKKYSSDFFLYSLLDLIIDNYFIVLEKIGDEMEIIDNILLNNPLPQTLERIYDFKRELIFIRKCIWPLREVLNKLDKSENKFISEKNKIYFRDLYDHAIQVIDNTETYRDIISGMMDIYLSSMSNKMNEIMKFLTIIGTIFIPLTFIVGVYGMNFEYMPELKMYYAYPLVWIIMLFISLFMIGFFKRKNWI